MSLVCNSYFICMQWYIIYMAIICTHMSFACHSCALVCHSYVLRMYSYVVRMSLACHFYITCMYSYATRMSFYHEPSIQLLFHFLKSGELATFSFKIAKFATAFRNYAVCRFFIRKFEFTTFSFETVNLATFSSETIEFPTFFNLKKVKNIRFATFLFKTAQKGALKKKQSSLKSEFGLADTSLDRVYLNQNSPWLSPQQF